jgi:hypothetical protein
MFLGMLDSNPDATFICTDPDPFINKLKMTKNLDFYCFVAFYDFFLSLKTDVNVPTKSDTQKNFDEI